MIKITQHVQKNVVWKKKKKHKETGTWFSSGGTWRAVEEVNNRVTTATAPHFYFFVRFHCTYMMLQEIRPCQEMQSEQMTTVIQ